MSSVGYVQNDYSQQGKVKDNPGFFKKLYAAQVGSLGAGVVTTAATIPITLGAMKQMVKINHNLTKGEVEILNKAGNKILKDSGLAEKGVKIFRTLSEKMQKDNKEFIEFCDKLPKFLGKILKRINPINMAAKGQNAFFNLHSNEILAVDKMALAQFHEMGHAMNKFSKGGRFLQNIRLDLIKQKNLAKFFGEKVKISGMGKIAGGVAAVIGLIGIFKNKKAEGEKPQGFFDKATTFVKDNIGKLTFLTMLPMVLEEGLASLKGEKAVKKLISPELFKKVKISNRLGLLTYATVATMAGIGASLASKIRDKIAQPNLNK